MANFTYIFFVLLGIIICAALSVYIITEFLRTFEAEQVYGTPVKQLPPPEVVAAITASLNVMLGVPNYNIIIKGIK